MTTSNWYLEGYVGDSKRLRRVHLYHFPFLIGRHQDCELTIDSTQVSRRHAELSIVDNLLQLRDLGSTNGTFLNHQRIESQCSPAAGDVVHFADQEYRIIEEQGSRDQDAMNQTNVGFDALQSRLPPGGKDFTVLLMKGAVSAAFQPIVDAERNVTAYEMLGRGTMPELKSAPYPLFQLAESLELEVNLSELFRNTGLGIAHELLPDGRFFFNIHPHELSDPERLLKGVEAIRRSFPDLGLVFEMHESAVVNPELIRRIRADLQNLNIGLAYDDFGAGQARLIELTEVPPDFVKFDIALVRDIDTAPKVKRQMLEMFQRLLADLNIATLAEGVETESEFFTLRDLGVGYYQGFYFGKPSAQIPRPN